VTPTNSECVPNDKEITLDDDSAIYKRLCNDTSLILSFAVCRLLVFAQTNQPHEVTHGDAHGQEAVRVQRVRQGIQEQSRPTHSLPAPPPSRRQELTSQGSKAFTESVSRIHTWTPL